MDKNPVSVSSIADGLIINGNITGTGDLRIGGCIEGEIVLKEGKIQVDRNGYIEGDVQVKDISISGEVRGTIQAGSRVAISSTGKIKGDVKTARIDIAEGAFLCGNFEVEDKVEV